MLLIDLALAPGEIDMVAVQANSNQDVHLVQENAIDTLFIAVAIPARAMPSRKPFSKASTSMGGQYLFSADIPMI